MWEIDPGDICFLLVGRLSCLFPNCVYSVQLSLENGALELVGIRKLGR